MHFEIVLDTVWLLCRLAFIDRDRCTERDSWLLDNSSALAASLTGRTKAQYRLHTEGSHVEDQVPRRWKGSHGAGPAPHLAMTVQGLEPQGARPHSGLGENWTHGSKGFLWPEDLQISSPHLT